MRKQYQSQTINNNNKRTCKKTAILIHLTQVKFASLIDVSRSYRVLVSCETYFIKGAVQPNQNPEG